MDARSELNLSNNVYPPFADAVRAGAADFLAKTGYECVVTSGTRTYAEQHALFLKGPSTTKADEGHGSHNFGLAVDIAPNHNLGDASFVPNYTVFKPGTQTMTDVWAVLVACMKGQRLKWGGDWKTMRGDYDHFYIGPDSPNQAMRDAFESAGFKGVWAEFALFEGE